MRKRLCYHFFSFSISLAMLLAGLTCFPFYVKAITQNEVESKLDYYISQLNGTTETGAHLLQGKQCKGFANWIFNEIFGVYIGPYPNSANYKITNPQAETIGVIDPGYLNENSARELLQKAVPGDYIQVQRSIARNCGPHSMIVRSVTNDGVYVFDCNSDSKNTIKFYLYTWSRFDYENRAMTLLHAWDYSTESNTKWWQNRTPVNVGDEFFAYIINTKKWNYLTNVDGKIYAQGETGAANQIWKFKYNDDGSYRIINCANGDSLDVFEASSDYGVQLETWENNDTDAQKWFIYGEPGAYSFRAACTDCVIDSGGEGTQNGDITHMWTKHDGEQQRLSIYKEMPQINVEIGNKNKQTKFTWEQFPGNERRFNLRIWKGTLWDGDSYASLWDLKETSALISSPIGHYEAYIDVGIGVQYQMTNVVKFDVKENYAPQYTITFDANGGTTPTKSITVTYEKKYGTFPTPTREGYAFTGWYTAKTSGTKIIADTIFKGTSNLILYAQWTVNKLSVHYNANGGILADNSDYYLANNGDIMKKADKTFGGQIWDYGYTDKNGLVNAGTFKLSRDGYTFKGWSLSKTGGTIYDQDDNTISAVSLYPDIKTKNETIMLYAVGGWNVILK